MSQPKKKIRPLPKDLRSLSDHDLMERLFGKRTMKVIDKVVAKNSKGAGEFGFPERTNKG